jgi:hypothetical protein
MAAEVWNHHKKNLAFRLRARRPQCYTQAQSGLVDGKAGHKNKRCRVMPDSLNIVAVTAAVLGGLFFLAALFAVKRRRFFRMLTRFTAALFWLALAGLFGAISIGIQGYRALTHEEIAATVRTEPLGPKRFRAVVRFPDNREAIYELAGDEFYVDAHILKWKPLANIFGLHTAYELDRISGRYADISEERDAARTIFPLAPEREIDLFSLRQRYAFLSPLLDAEYGSGTFTLANEAAEFEVRVSTSGLLVRRRPAAAQPAP